MLEYKVLQTEFQVDSEEESFIISSSRILKQTGLSRLVHENNLIADLLQQASSCRKQRCLSREAKKKNMNQPPLQAHLR